jgi:hypothetical protein
MPQVFGAETLPFVNLAQAVYTQLEPPDPIVLHYRVGFARPAPCAFVGTVALTGTIPGWRRPTI